MARKKEITEESILDIRKAMDAGKVVIGTERTLELLKRGGLAKVFLSSNCPDDVQEDIAHYSKLSGAEVIKLNHSNDELGDLCKKPFNISVLSVLKV